MLPIQPQALPVSDADSEDGDARHFGSHNNSISNQITEMMKDSSPQQFFVLTGLFQPRTWQWFGFQPIALTQQQNITQEKAVKGGILQTTVPLAFVLLGQWPIAVREISIIALLYICRKAVSGGKYSRVYEILNDNCQSPGMFFQYPIDYGYAQGACFILKHRKIDVPGKHWTLATQSISSQSF